jgi:hypothetical protein
MTKNDIRALVMRLTGQNTQRGAARQMADDLHLPERTTLHHMQGNHNPGMHATVLYIALGIGGAELYDKVKEDVAND